MTTPTAPDGDTIRTRGEELAEELADLVTQELGDEEHDDLAGRLIHIAAQVRKLVERNREVARPAPQQPPAQEREAAYAEGRWCGECRYGVVESPPCCTQTAPPSEADSAGEHPWGPDPLGDDWDWRPGVRRIAAQLEAGTIEPMQAAAGLRLTLASTPPPAASSGVPGGNGLVEHLQRHRRDVLRALRANVSGGADYWRWQGHAELARQLLERLGAEVPK